MSTEEKMTAYVERTNMSHSDNYWMTVAEVQALKKMLDAGKVFECLGLAFSYGMAKGCRMTKKAIKGNG